MRLRSGIRVVFAGAVAGALALCLAAMACGNSANDVAGCQQLENARCARAIACGIDLDFPLHSGSTPEDAVQACQLFYQDACLHGFVTTLNLNTEATMNDVQDCLNAINGGNCNAVLNPQTVPGCLWLNPPDSGTDATDASADTFVVVVETGVTATGDTGVDTGVQSCEATCDATCDGDPNCIEMCEETCEGN